MEDKFEFCRFRMLFNRLEKSSQDKLLKKYNIGALGDFHSLHERDQQTILIEANTELYNNLVGRIRNYSGYELCLLYNYMKNVKP